MFRLQLVNVYTQEVLREQDYKNNETILNMIDSFEDEKDKEEECFIFDSGRRTLRAVYVTHNICNDDGVKVYRLLFKVKLNEVQVPIG